MAELKKKTKSCTYVYPAQCAETAAFASSSTADYLKKNGVEGYDLVYIADLKNQHVF